jgi:succinate dehydrogenase / fumarate reductase flavoprotein subunit
MAKTLNSRIPEGPVAEKWTNYKAHQRLVNPKNKLKLDVIVVGTGLAGASAAASLGEMGFNVLNFCIQDSPRRAHSIAAQGGINAAKNYQNDGDSVYRLFYDTVKGGDYRAREANVYRLAEVSSTSAWLRACLSHVSTAACSPTVLSAVRRYHVRSTPRDRPASSCCLAPTLR